jgi:hypothetical protein
MTDESSKAGESAVEQHVRKVLAQLSALQARLRAQEPQQSGSCDAVEIEREDDSPGGINGTYRPT